MKRILVPLDGSNAGEIVLPYVEEIVFRLGEETHFVSVCQPETQEMDHLYGSYLERVAREARERMIVLRAKEKAVVKSQVLIGKPAEEILRYADENRIELIAMASRGASGQGPWLLGSIAAKVIRATSKPVLLIRVAATKEALAEKRLIRKILVPLDGSTLGEAAVPLSETLALALNAEIVLFRAIRGISPWAGDSPIAAPLDLEHRKGEAVKYLTGIEQSLRRKGIRVSTALTVAAPADAIIDYAKANAVDLIAMSTHGRSGMNRWVFGSVTDKVLHAGDTAVLTVKPQP